MGCNWEMGTTFPHREFVVGLHLQGVDIIEDFIPLDLGSIDIILGIYWLETLGGTFVNWKHKCGCSDWTIVLSHREGIQCWGKP